MLNQEVVKISVVQRSDVEFWVEDEEGKFERANLELIYKNLVEGRARARWQVRNLAAKAGKDTNRSAEANPDFKSKWRRVHTELQRIILISNQSGESGKL